MDCRERWYKCLPPSLLVNICILDFMQLRGILMYEKRSVKVVSSKKLFKRFVENYGFLIGNETLHKIDLYRCPFTWNTSSGKTIKNNVGVLAICVRTLAVRSPLLRFLSTHLEAPGHGYCLHKFNLRVIRWICALLQQTIMIDIIMYL